MAHEVDVENMENLKPFLAVRKAVKNLLNEDIDYLKTKIEKVLSENKERALCSIKFREGLTIFLNEQVRENLFPKAYYSEEDGLKITSIEILHKEYVGDIEFKVFNNIVIRFNFENPDYNNNWNSFSLDSLGWNDEGFRISEQSMGLCLNPRFKEENYGWIKSLISSLKETII